MALDQYGYAGGITALSIIIISYLCATIFLSRYVRSQKLESLLQGIVFIAVGSNWLGVVLSFLRILLGGSPLPHVLMIRSWAWAPAVVSSVWLYLALMVVKPKLKFYAAAIYGVLGLIYFYLIYTQTTQYSTYQLVGGLPDSSMAGIGAIFLMLYILTAILLVAPVYLWIGFKSEHAAVQLQGKIIGAAILTFGFFATFDSVLLLPSVLYTISVRIVLIISIFLIYLGFALPEWFLQRFAGSPRAVGT